MKVVRCILVKYPRCARGLPVIDDRRRSTAWDQQYQTGADTEHDAKPNAKVEKILRQSGGEETHHGERGMQVKALLK